MLRTIASLLLVMWIASRADAQTAGNIPLDGFRPAMDSRGYVTVDASQVLDDREVSFGLGGLDWEHHLLALGARSAGTSVDDVLTATLVGAFGVRLGRVPLELGLSLPFILMAGNRNGESISGQGVGNLALRLKTRFLDARHAPVGLAAIASVYLPTTTQDGRFLGEPAREAVPEAIAIADTQLGSRVRLALNGGVRVRSRDTIVSDPMMMGAPTTGAITAGSELPFGLAVGYALAPERFELVGEVYGTIPLGAHENYQPLEALAGVKLYLASNSFLSLGAGRGLVSHGANPDMRAFIGIVFEPGLGDRAHADIPTDEQPLPPPADNDRIAERSPDCSNLETPDEQCPDRDSDGDGIVDKDDLCPFEPGPASEAGCPNTRKIVLRDSKFIVPRPIMFEFDKAVIRPASYPVLDELAAAIRDHAEITLIEVQGHTDERGGHAYNVDLSSRRAAAVVVYLTSHGVDAARLTSQGYGETQPVDRSHNELAWAKNRRVEFVILKPAQ
jgi:outer membrane protein OmpA-like peptidoglycan-associated protein